MAPFQTMATMKQDVTHNLGQNDIDVHVLPLEDNLTENTTVITDNTSDRSGTDDGFDQWPADEKLSKLSFNRHVFLVYTYSVIVSAFISPSLMIILPKIDFVQKTFLMFSSQQKLMFSACHIECKGSLLGILFKIILLLIGTWAVFVKPRKICLPRLLMFRNGVLILTTLCVASYWLFYIVQITDNAKHAISGDIVEYSNLVNYAESLTNTLLFIYFIAVLLIEIRHLQPVYCVKIVRIPDGTSKSYAIGQFSIQSAALWVLEKYYTEFPVFNPFLERLPLSKSSRRVKMNNFKFYEVDNRNATIQTDICSNEQIASNFSSNRKDSSHNERFYEEQEYDRRVHKRKARLITATIEAFSHIQRLSTNTEPDTQTTSIDPFKAAQSIFPVISRALQKYLRITRQQPNYSIDSIVDWLAQCLTKDATPRVFLEPFFNNTPVLLSEKEKQQTNQHWALICEGEIPSKPIFNNCEFQLRQGEIALLCSIHQLPHFYLTEQIAILKSNRLILRINSEISTQ